MRVEQDGKTFEFRSFPKLVLSAALQPLTYSWSQKGAQSSQLDLDLQASPAKARYKTVTGEDDQRDFELPRDVVILDDNVLHHYQLIVYLYLRQGGGKQAFAAFVPQEALPGSLAVQDAGLETVELAKRKLTLRHLVFSTDLKHIDVWADDQGRVQRVYISDGQLDAVRKQ